MPRIALCLFLTFPLSLLAAGHDVSSIRYAPSDLPAGPAAVAYSGGQFLTLWPMSLQIYGSLADASGRSLSPEFAAVPFAATDVLQLTAAGTGYLAIWNQEGAPSAGTFNSDGALERRVQLGGNAFVNPRLAFNGTNLLVVGLIGTPTGVVAVSVYDLTGRLVSQFPLPVAFNESYAVTSAGGDFIVVTAGSSGINEWRVATDGTILSTRRIQPPMLSLYDIAVTAKNGKVAMAWEQRQFQTVSSAVIQPDGSVTRSELPAGGLRPLQGMVILPVDIGFFVAWNAAAAPPGPSRTGVLAIRLDDAGVPLDARPLDLGDGPLTAAASSGKVIELTLHPAFATQAKLIADIDASGISPRTREPVAVTPVRQLFPVVAGNGAGFTAAWMDKSKDSQNAEAGRVTAMGDALDGPGITLGLQTSSPPAIAHGSTGELTVWNANGHLLAARLSPFGAVFDAPPIVIAPTISGSYAEAWNGSRFLVVWTDGSQLFGAFVGPDSIATPPMPLGIQSPLNTASSLDLAWDGQHFILVFAEITPGPNPCHIEGCVELPDRIRLLRVSADGVAIDRDPVRIPGVHVRAHVASSGAESMIALDNNTDTSAMLVRDDGAVLGLGPEIPLFHWINSYGSDIAWNGSLYVVAWRYSWAKGPLQKGPAWLGVSRLSQSGVPLGSLFTPTAGPPESGQDFLPVSVAANDAGDAAIVVSEIAPPSYAARARLYLMSELAPMPPAPRAPRNAVTYVMEKATLITWESDSTQAGFLIEGSVDFGKTWFPFATVLDMRSVTLTNNILFRVSAIGPGGFSEPVVSTIGSSIERRRAARR